MNHHVPAAITEGLRRRSVDVLTAFEDGASLWDDEKLLARATELGRVLFSQDEDLLAVIVSEGRGLAIVFECGLERLFAAFNCGSRCILRAFSAIAVCH